jgi:hypothetical protein
VAPADVLSAKSSTVTVLANAGPNSGLVMVSATVLLSSTVLTSAATRTTVVTVLPKNASHRSVVTVSVDLVKTQPLAPMTAAQAIASIATLSKVQLTLMATAQ